MIINHQILNVTIVYIRFVYFLPKEFTFGYFITFGHFVTFGHFIILSLSIRSPGVQTKNTEIHGAYFQGLPDNFQSGKTVIFWRDLWNSQKFGAMEKSGQKFYKEFLKHFGKKFVAFEVRIRIWVKNFRYLGRNPTKCKKLL